MTASSKPAITSGKPVSGCLRRICQMRQRIIVMWITPPPTALLVGTELFGCSPDAIALADQQVMIPMMGMTQSLNVSVACAIVLYEAMRQRQNAGMYNALSLDADEAYQKRFRWIHPKAARWCDENGVDYPPLDEDGEIIGAIDSPA